MKTLRHLSGIALVLAGFLAATTASAAGSTATVFGQTVSVDTPTVFAPGGSMGLSQLLDQPSLATFDAAGDMVIPNYAQNTLTVVAARTTTLFGQRFVADVPTTLDPGPVRGALSALTITPMGATFDSSGDLFIACWNGTIVEVPAANTTVFGQSVRANVPVVFNPGDSNTLTPLLIAPDQVVFNSAGDMYIVDQNYNNSAGAIVVVSLANQQFFGQSFAADHPTIFNPGGKGALATLLGTSGPDALTFDAHGDALMALCQSAGGPAYVAVTDADRTLFGQSFKSAVPTVMDPGGQGEMAHLAGPVCGGGQIAVDARGDLLTSDYATNQVTVVPAATGVAYGQAMTQNVPEAFNPGTHGTLHGVLEGPYGLLIDDQGDLFITNTNARDIVVVAAARPTVPGAPRSVRVTHRHASSVRFAWTAPASDGGSRVTGYLVRAAAGRQCRTTSATTCTIAHLNPHATYTVRVWATNAVGTGAPAVLHHVVG